MRYPLITAACAAGHGDSGCASYRLRLRAHSCIVGINERGVLVAHAAAGHGQITARAKRNILRRAIGQYLHKIAASRTRAAC